MTPKKWDLISRKDVSPHHWFPIEMRTYKLPGGKIINDFTVTTIPDVSMIVPITRDNQVVLVNQFKPGMDEITLEFPAGRIEPNMNFLDLAQKELEEETGIRVEKKGLIEFAVLGGFTTKGTEKVHFFLARDCVFNSKQHFDENEDIEVVTLTFPEMEEKIFKGHIYTTQTIAGWELAKKHFPEVIKL
jgi:ADP-ribose pyrophosphatase